MKAIQPAVDTSLPASHGADSKEIGWKAVFIVIFSTVILNLIFEAIRYQKQRETMHKHFHIFTLTPVL